MSTEMSIGNGEISEDAILGGRLVLRQPRRGHRFGHDAVLLAAAVAARSGERAIELGAGVGAAGLALAHRVAGLKVTLLELDPALAALAGDNVKRNGLGDRVRVVCLDATASVDVFAAAGLSVGATDHVLMNPPFNLSRNPSPDRRRRMAHSADAATLARWLGAAERLLRPGGMVALIWRADGLADVLAALEPRFGAITILPIHGKPDSSAIRVIASACKGRGGALALRPGFLLADARGKPTAQAEAVLREGAVLPLAQPDA
jgi:tRNA1(Val) A37 N6-methylase TrmN6